MIAPYFQRRGAVPIRAEDGVLRERAGERETERQTQIQKEKEERE